MPTSNFQQWNPAAVNQESDAAYTADSLRSGGAPVDGLLPSATFNKFAYQASTFVGAFGMMMVAKGYTVDDADISVLAAVLGNLVTDNETLPQIVVVGYSPTPVFNAAASDGFSMVLTGNITSATISGVSPGQLLAFYFTQDSVGGRTIGGGWTYGQPDPTPNSISLLLIRVGTATALFPVGAVVSSNGSFFQSAINVLGAAVFQSLVTAQSFTLATGTGVGKILIHNGTSFLPKIRVRNILTGSRSLNGSAIQNTTGAEIDVEVTAYTANTYGSGWTTLAMVGPTSGGLSQIGVARVSNDGGMQTLSFKVLPGEWYAVNTAPVSSGGSTYYGTNSVTPLLQQWIEYTWN